MTPDGTILHWLRRNKPTKVRLHLARGESRTLDRPSQDRGRWTVLERAILQMDPTYIEALGDAGEVLASRTLEAADEEPTTAPAQVVTNDPMTAMVAAMPTLVQLVVDASDAAAQRHADAYRLAFEQQLSLVKVLADRLHGLEKAYQSVLMAQAQQAGSSESENALVAQVLGHAMANGAASNGAAKPPGGTPQ